MAGHSQFKNIMYRKGAQDAKRAKIFAKVIREITVAVKAAGAEIDANPRLRSAILSAREANMPKDTVDRAINKALGGSDEDTYQEVRYEGYGHGGIAVIVEALTNNRNRASAEIRSIFSKCGGSLGEVNSVSFLFDHLGFVRYQSKVADAEAMFEAALEAGADDVQSFDDWHDIFCALENLGQVRDSLAKRFGDPEAARYIWRAKDLVPISDNAAAMEKLIDMLEDNDDVQNIYTNVAEIA